MARLAAVRPSSAFATVDFDKPGKQLGFIMIPHSPHDDAWGVTRIPVAVITNGTGPTVIIEGGNHIANNRVYRWRPQSADWMAEQLRAA